MNAYDTVRMHDVMRPLGYAASDTPEDADLVILNTCHIREKAEEKVYSDLGRIRDLKKERGGEMLIAVGGCVGQAEGEEIIRRAPYVDMVMGSHSYHQLPEMVTKAIRGQGGIVELDFPPEPKFDYLPDATSQGASAFLSVQEGCDKFCTFCVVPYTRGAEYSRKVSAILEEAKRLVDQGTMDIMLLGQNVNAYHGEGADGRSWSLADLMAELSKMDGLKRIRYITSHPRDMTQDLIDIHGEEKIMPYLHLPIQSGSNSVLKRMNRKHTTDLYLDILSRLRKVRPDIAFTSDFIVGFPGETDAEFEETMELVRQVNYAAAYSFKYSPRPGTPAATDENQVPEEVKKLRLARLQALLQEQQMAFNAATVGKTFEVLFDRDGKLEGQLLGKSPYMQSVHISSQNAEIRNQIAKVRITGGYLNSLAGEIVVPNVLTLGTRYATL